MAAWREHLYAFLHRNATGAAHFFELPTEQVIEVGVTVEI
jgi:KUP system potassium uptake protein